MYVWLKQWRVLTWLLQKGAPRLDQKCGQQQNLSWTPSTANFVSDLSMAYLPLHVPWIFKLNVGRYTIPGSHAFDNIWSRKLSQVVASCTTGSLSADASGCTSGKPWQRPRGGLYGTMTFLFCRRVIPLSAGKTNMAMEKKFTIWRCMLEKVNLQSLANHVSLLEGYWDFLSQRVLGTWKRQCTIFWFEGNWSPAVRRLVFQLLENVHPFFFGWIELKKIFWGGMDVWCVAPHNVPPQK